MDNNNSVPNSAPIEQTNTEPTENTEHSNSITEALSENALPAAKKEAQKEIKAEVKRKFKELEIKVDGKTYKEELPFEIDEGQKEWMTRQLQMAKMAHSRANYAKNLENEISQFITNLKSDPLSVLSDPNLGVDLREIVQQYAKREIENSKKTPEQLKSEQLEAELAKIHKERDKEKEEFKKKEAERLQEKAYVEYEQGIIDAIETATDLPKSTYVVRKFADYMLSALEMGVKVTPQEVLPLVRQEIHNDIKQMFAAAPDETVENFFGKDRLTKMRKKNVDKAMATAPLKAVKDVGIQKVEEKKPVSYRDFLRISNN
jgi:hypothetical protein